MRHVPSSTLASRPSVLSSAFPSSDGSTQKGPLHYLRPLLSSQDPNAHYTFLASLLHINRDAWTGAADENSALSEQEVIKVMGFLDSDDATLRGMVCAVSTVR